MKKIIIIVGFIVLIIIFALALYFIFFKSTTPPLVNEEEPVITNQAHLPVSRDAWQRMTIEQRQRAGLPLYQWPEVEVTNQAQIQSPQVDSIARGNITFSNSLTSENSIGASLATNGQNVVFYNKDEGKFYEVDLNGNKKNLSDKVFPNVEKINWAPTKDKAILEFPDSTRIIYDFQKKKQIFTIPSNWQEPSFSPSGKEIAFKIDSKYSENRWLSVASVDGANARAIEPMGDNQDKVIVDWTGNRQIIAFSRTGRPIDAWTQSIIPIGQYGENIPSLVVDGQGFEEKWDNLGEKIAYSVFSPDTNFNPYLFVINASGDKSGTGKIATGLQTEAHKCVFNQLGDTLYCAVPRNLPYGSGLVSELAKNTVDDFYKVDLNAGKTAILAVPAYSSYNIESIFLSADESTLFFTDKDSGNIEYIKLK